MKTKRRRNNCFKSEMPLSSMIDVVFLLLVYFIVTQRPIIDESYLGVNLPGEDKGPRPPLEPPFLIEVRNSSENHENEKYYMNDNAMEISEIAEILERQARIFPERNIIISCGPNARHQKLVKLLDLSNDIGVKNISIINNEYIAFKEKTDPTP